MAWAHFLIITIRSWLWI